MPAAWVTGAFGPYTEALMNGTRAPDRIYRDFSNHVYDPSSGKGGAPRKVKQWYGWYVSNLTNGNWSVAMYSAGTLSHYLDDIANPMHTGTSEQEETVHSRYENDVNEHLNEFTVSVTLELVNDPEAYAITVATFSHQYYDNLVSEYSSSRWTNNVQSITQICLNEAVKAVASIWKQGIVDSGIQIPEFQSINSVFLFTFTIVAAISILRSARPKFSPFKTHSQE
jgi:hypothetical protein